MPKYVIERQYLLPIYQRLVVEADSVEEACQKAIDHDDWLDTEEDGEGARATTVAALKRIPDGTDACELGFDPDGPETQSTKSLSSFLYEGDTSTIHSDVPAEFAEEAA